MTRTLLLCGLFLMSITQTFAQADNLFDETYDFSKSHNSEPPQAFSFDQYGNTPVNYYNGSVNINIPLLSIPTQGVNLHLSASYSTHGVAVAQTASEIGIDWNLNIGGTISREIRGTSDLAPAQSSGPPWDNETNVGAIMSYHMGWLDPNHDPIVDIVSPYPSSNPNAGYLPYNGQRVTAGFSTMVDDIMRDKDYDTEPDIFTLSINGISATFFYDQNKNLIINSEQELDIQYPSADNGEWIITDGYGNTYYFGEDPLASSKKLFTEWSIEQLPNHNGGLLTRWNATQWKVRKIVTTEGEEVNFSYDSYFTKQGHHNATYVLKHTGNVDVDVPMSAASYIRSWKTSINNVTYEKDNLLYTLQFDYSNRPDNANNNGLYGFRKLNSVELRHGTNSFLQRKVEFSYLGYTDRLWLEKIILKGLNETVGEEYSFDYHNEDQIPIHTSKAVDYFGHYNNETSNQGLPPKICPFYHGSYHQSLGGALALIDLSATNLNFSTTATYYQAHDERNTDTNTILYGYLKRMDYPTGGYSEYEYEAHSYDPPAQLPSFQQQGAGIRIQSIKDYSGTNVLVNQRSFEYSDGKLMSVPFFQISNTRPGQNVYSNCVLDIVQISSQPIIPTPRAAQGSMVGYGTVEELSNNGYNGKTQYSFYNEAHTVSSLPRLVVRDDGSPIDNPNMRYMWFFGGIPYPRLQEQNGKLLHQKVYERENSAFTIVSETENVYSTSLLGQIIGDMYRSPIGTQGKDVVTAHDEFCSAGDGSNQVALMTHHHYNHSFRKMALDETISREYTPNGTLVSSQTFSYTNSLKNRIRKTETTNSDQIKETTTYYYVDDLDGSTDPNATFVSSMMNDHKVALPVAQLMGSGSGMHQGVIQLYNNNGKLHQSYTYENAPKGFYNFNISHVGNGEWELEAHYTYDANGDIIMIERENGTRNSLVRTNNNKGWANCAHAHYQDIAYTSFEDRQWVPASAAQAHVTESEHFSGDYALLVKAAQFGFSKEMQPHSQDKAFVLSTRIKTPATFGSQNASLIIQVLDLSNNQLAWLSTAIPNTNDAWQNFEQTVDLSQYSGTVKVKLELWNNNSNSGLFVDEVRFHPIEAQMTTYTQSVKTSSGLSSLVDARGYLQTFEYDDLGRLQFAKDQDGNILQTNQYHFRP